MDNNNVNKKTSLDELKKVTREHFLRELDIMEMILNLSRDDVREFRKWYITQPYVKGIGDIQEICQTKNNKLND